MQAEGGGVVLRQTKSNFGKPADPVNIALEFQADRVSVHGIAAEDDRMSGIFAHLPAMERVARALSEHPEGVTPEAIAPELGMGEKTVRNYLSGLKQRGRAEPIGDGRWRPIPNSQSLKELGIGNEQQSKPEHGSDYDHDKQRQKEARAHIAAGNLKRARMTAEMIRGRRERERLLDEIDALQPATNDHA